MNTLHRIATTALVTASIIFAGCNASRTAKGGAIGAGAGAGVGAVIGNQFPGENGTAIGAAVGGTAGALIGRKMDKQAEELRNDLEGASVERVGEGIKITFDSGLLFDVDKSALSSTASGNLAALAETLNKYPDTDVLIEGHTDADGAEDYNQRLSVERAQSVKAFLLGKSVAGARMSTSGYGETQPMADNTTAAGKAKNRRVDIAIYANKRMKRAAERGEI